MLLWLCLKILIGPFPEDPINDNAGPYTHDDNKPPVHPSPPFGTDKEALATAIRASFASASAS
eukprot:3820410-Ditylum_brightwellii.AAC.1